MSKPRVLVTPRALTRSPKTVNSMLSDQGYEAVFSSPGEQPSIGQLRALLADCVGWIAGVEPITAEVLECGMMLKVISRFGTGVSNIDLVETRRLGIKVVTASGANALSVAELALALTLDCVRGVSESARLVSAGEWQRRIAREFADLDVLVVGYGAIGRKYADLMSFLGARISVFDPFLRDGEPSKPGMNRVHDLAGALRQTDVVSLHCPPSERPLLSGLELSECRGGLIVVNTARSDLVDDDALLAALESGAVANYAVDAHDGEPPAMTPLLLHPGVIATPHVGAYTVEAIQRTLTMSVENLVDFFIDRGPLAEVLFTEELAENLDRDALTTGLRIYWLGQAGFLIRTCTGYTILIDAYLSDVLSEKYQGTLFPHERMMSAPISPEDLPKIDLLLISHGHTDHLDPATVSAIAQRHPESIFVVPNRVRELAVERGIPSDRIVTMLGDEAFELLDGIRIHAIPSAHEELDINSNGSSCLGYMIEVGDDRIYHSGDCVPYSSLVERLILLKPNIALLPVNGRDEFRKSNGVPGNFTLAEALELCEQVGISAMVAHHWGMFHFNTIPESALREQRANYKGGVSWYIPSINTFLER